MSGVLVHECEWRAACRVRCPRQVRGRLPCPVGPRAPPCPRCPVTHSRWGRQVNVTDSPHLLVCYLPL